MTKVNIIIDKGKKKEKYVLKEIDSIQNTFLNVTYNV
nr:MAG TPA: hypothetical protein [Caudoviricetes sp.]